MIPIINQLQDQFPEDEYSWLLSALREDSLVWNTLQDPALIKTVFAEFGNDLLRWSPAAVALFLIDPSISLDKLTHADFSTTPSSIRTQATDFYEEFAYNSSGESNSITLKQAGLLALALRERRRVVGSWDNLESEMNILQPAAWKSAIACLFGMLPNPGELLDCLINIEPKSAYVQLALHAVLSSPASPDKSVDTLYNLVNNISITSILSILRLLATKRLNLAAVIAEQLLADMDVKESKSANDLADLQSRLYKAELFQTAGKHNDAATEFDSAWDSVEQIKVDRSARLSISAAKQNKNDLAEELIKPFSQDDYIKPSSSSVLMMAKLMSGFSTPDSQHDGDDQSSQLDSVDALAKAISLLKTGNTQQALQYANKALAALDAGDEGLSGDSTEYIQLLMQVYQDLGEFRNAEQVAKIGLEYYPNNETLLLKISDLQASHYHSEESIQTAKLASALNPSSIDNRRSLAHRLVANQDWEQAYQTLDKLVAMQSTPSDEDAISLAACALKINNPTKAVELSNIALENNPSNALAHTIQGQAQMLLGNNSDARQHFENATQNDPTNSEPWIQLANLQEAEGNFDEALTTLTAAIHATDEDLHLNIALGQTHHRAGNDNKAAKQYSKSIEIANKLPTEITQADEDICITLAKSLQEIGKNQESEELLNTLYQKNPSKAKIALAYGKQLRTTGNHQAAIEPLEIAQKSLRKSPEAQLEYAQVVMETNGDKHAAVKAINAAEEIDPSNPIVFALKAELEAAQDTPENAKEAIRLYEKALASPLSQQQSWQKKLNLGIAKVALNASQPKLAIEKLQSMPSSSESDVQILQLLSEAYYQANKFDDSLEAARQAFSIAPDDDFNLNWYADQAIRLDQVDDAIKAFEHAYKLDPKNINVLVRAGKLQRHKGDRKGAIKTLKRIPANKAGLTDLLQSAAEFSELDENKAAIRFLNLALEKSPEPPADDLLNDLLTAYELDNDSKAALKIVQQQIQYDPANHKLHSKQAQLYTKLGNTPQALTSIQKSLEIYPKDAQLHATAASIFKNSGDLAEAFDHINQAIMLQPEERKFAYLSAEIENSNLDPESAYKTLRKLSWSVDDIASIGNSKSQAETLEALFLYGETAIVKGDIQSAQHIVDVSDTTNHPRSLALQSRLAKLNNDQSQADKFVDLAIQQLNSIDDADKNNDNNLAKSIIPVADAARANLQWEQALDLYTQAGQLNSSDALPHYLLAKTLLVRAEFEHDCQAVDITRAAPGKDALGKNAQSKFVDAIETTLSLTTNNKAINLIQHLNTRGLDSFDVSIRGNERPANYPSTPEETAGMIAFLGRTEQAAKVESIADQHANHPLALTQKSIALASANPKSALEYAHQAADISNNPINQALLAKLALENNQPQLGINAIEESLSNWSEEPRLHFVAGALYQNFNETNTAISHLKKAIQIEPEFGDSHLLLGKVFAKANMNEEAIQALETAVAKIPDSAEGWYDLSNAYLQTGKFGKAASTAKNVANLSPNQNRSTILEAKIALGMDKPEKAYKIVQRALKTDPGNLDLLTTLSDTLLALNRAEEAIEAIDRALEKSDNSKLLQLAKVNIVNQTKGDKASLGALKKVAKQFPDDYLVLSTLSKALFDRNKVEDAIKVSQHAVKVNADNLNAHELSKLHHLLSAQLQSTGQLDQAIHHLHKALDLSPHFLEAYLSLGHIHQERRQPHKAMEFFQKATTIAPHDPRAFIETGKALQDSKDFSGAESMIRNAAALAPKDAGIQRHLAAIVALNLVHPTSA